MKSMIKLILTTAFMLMSVNSWAELPSWGMTENQYKLPNFESKLGEIGAQANKNNWLLKVTAPKDWHSKIRTALTQTGERDVQVTFKDSLYQSIAISAVKGAKIAKITPSTTNVVVPKQVVIDKPVIDTEIEAPDFGETDFKNNSNELLENIAGMEISVPSISKREPKTTAVAKPNQPEIAEIKTETIKKEPVVLEVEKVQAEPVPSEPIEVKSAEPTAQPSAEEVDTTSINREFLRKKHARTKRVVKEISYSQIMKKDELFIKNSVVLVKRFVNQGVVLFFWMKEAYDPLVHELVSKGSGKFRKDPEANELVKPEEVVIKETVLGFIAVDTMIEDQDDLRREFGRNKRVDNSINTSQLKKKDVLHVLNQTVLVVRPISKSQNLYLWLTGDTTINREVERKGDNKFIIK